MMVLRTEPSMDITSMIVLPVKKINYEGTSSARPSIAELVQ